MLNRLHYYKSRLFQKGASLVWSALRSPHTYIHTYIHTYYDKLFPLREYDPCLPISKTIHQITIGKSNIKENTKVLENIDFLKANNPQWTYKIWDDESIEEYILKHYGSKIYEYYSRISNSYGAAKADFFRYLLIYNEGGLYLDIKSTFRDPLDKHLKDSDRYILAYWDREYGADSPKPKSTPDTPCGLIMNWYVLAAKHHPLLREVIIQILRNMDNYNPITSGRGQAGVFNITGPTTYTQTLLKYRMQYPDVSFDYIIQDWGGEYSIFGDGQTHSGLFQKNYKTQRSPIIWNIIKPARILISRLWR